MLKEERGKYPSHPIGLSNLEASFHNSHAILFSYNNLGLLQSVSQGASPLKVS